MELQNEKAKLEKAMLLLDCIESAYRRIKIHKEVDDMLDFLYVLGNKSKSTKSINDTKAAIKKLERSYNRLMCFDELTELRKFKQERTGIVEYLRCEL